jgi:hypothetical protein
MGVIRVRQSRCTYIRLVQRSLLCIHIYCIILYTVTMLHIISPKRISIGCMWWSWRFYTEIIHLNKSYVPHTPCMRIDNYNMYVYLLLWPNWKRCYTVLSCTKRKYGSPRLCADTLFTLYYYVRFENNALEMKKKMLCPRCYAHVMIYEKIR